MLLSSWTRALPRCWLLLATWLWLSLVSSARAEDAPVVVWLDAGEAGDRQARERALRLELDARAIVLLGAQPSAADAQAAAGPVNRAALARQTLMHSGAAAVLWLERDPSRPVSWLRVVHLRNDAVGQAPLPHPPEAIEPELFAIAAASLLEQVLRAPPAEVAPGLEPPADAQAKPPAVPTPAATAAASAPTTTPAPQPRPAAHSTSTPPAPAGNDWFVQAGVTFSFAHVHSGMEAATRPSLEEIFVVLDDRHYFNDMSPWVPDRDSFDDLEQYVEDSMGNVVIDPDTDMPVVAVPRGTTPVPGDCSADGIATGPLDLEDASGDPFTQLEPSRYCVRVRRPGFASVPALRLVFGRWLLPRFALGLLYQGHFGIDADSVLGNQLFGLHAEYAVLGARGRGVTLSLLGELTLGRTETPTPSPADGPSVNALSGPLGVQAGALVRFWPASSFALLASPTLGMRFPATQLLIDLAAGVEVPF